MYHHYKSVQSAISPLVSNYIYIYMELYHHLKNSFHPCFLATPLSSRRGGAAVAPRGVVLRRSASRREPAPPGDLQPFFAMLNQECFNLFQMVSYQKT